MDSPVPTPRSKIKVKRITSKDVKTRGSKCILIVVPFPFPSKNWVEKVFIKKRDRVDR